MLRLKEYREKRNSANKKKPTDCMNLSSRNSGKNKSTSTENKRESGKSKKT